MLKWLQLQHHHRQVSLLDPSWYLEHLRSLLIVWMLRWPWSSSMYAAASFFSRQRRHRHYHGGTSQPIQYQHPTHQNEGTMHPRKSRLAQPLLNWPILEFPRRWTSQRPYWNIYGGPNIIRPLFQSLSMPIIPEQNIFNSTWQPKASHHLGPLRQNRRNCPGGMSQELSLNGLHQSGTYYQLSTDCTHGGL